MFPHQGATNTIGAFTEGEHQFEVALLVPDVTQELLVPNAMPLFVLIKQRQPLLVPLDIYKTPVTVFVSNRNIQYFGGMSGVS